MTLPRSAEPWTPSKELEAEIDRIAKSAARGEYGENNLGAAIEACCEQAIAAACAPRGEAGAAIRMASDADVEAVEQLVGMGAGAWDMVSPNLLLECVQAHFLRLREAENSGGGVGEVEALKRWGAELWPCAGDGLMCNAGAEMNLQTEGDYVRRDDVLALFPSPVPEKAEGGV